MSTSLSRAYVSLADKLSLSLLERYVLWLLCDYMNDRTGQCYPSIPTLAAKSGATQRGVIAAISTLEKEGFILIQRSPGRGNRYQIVSPEQWQIKGEPVNSVHPCTQFTREDSSLHPCTEFITPVNSVHHTRELSSPEPIKEPLIEPAIELLKEEARAKNKYVSYESLGLTSLPKRWADWLAQAYPTFVPDRVFDQFSSFWNKTAATKTLDGWFEQFRKSTKGIPPSLHEYMAGIVDEKPGKTAQAKPKHQAYMDGPVYSLEEMGLA